MVARNKTKRKKPSPAGNNGNGRAKGGRFVKGNKCGKGNPHLIAVGLLRTAIYETVTREDMIKVVKKLIIEAKKGKPWAVREFMDRAVGKAVTSVELSGDQGGPLALYVNIEDRTV